MSGETSGSAAAGRSGVDAGSSDRSGRDRARDVLVEGLRGVDLDVERVGTDTWMTMLEGQWKRTIPVMLRVDDRSLHAESLLCGSLDEGHAEVYAYLLRRNQKSLPIHFALSDDGDVIMTGKIPFAALDATSFDRLLGSILATADEVFNAVLRKGFAGYIDAEQRWRAANDLPANPVDRG